MEKAETSEVEIYMD